MNREPVLTAGAIVGAILSLVAALVAFGVVDWSEEQIGALEAALVAIVPMVLSLVGAWLARRQVTPVSDPRDNDGTPLVLDRDWGE